MDIMEIVLLAAGGIVFILSFLIPAKREESSEETRGLAKEDIKTLVSEELEAVRGHVDDVVEEAVTYSIEKTERSLERLSNEKIMAVNEYSDTVLTEIHKNHEEVMFLYDMLNDKHANLKDTVSEINRTVKEAKETKREAEEMVNTFQRLAPEKVIPLKTMALSSTPIPVAAPMPVPAQGLSAAPPQKVLSSEPASSQTKMTPLSQMLQQVNTVPQTPAFVTAQQSVSQNAFTTQDVMEMPAEAGQAEAASQTQTVSQSDIVQPTSVSGHEAPVLSGVISFTQETDVQGRNYNDRILELYKSGKSKVAIAKELNLGVGEVKLVIDLYKNRSEK